MPEENNDIFFESIASEAQAAPTQDTPAIANNTADEARADIKQFRRERHHYETRVNNMRMQFAWASIILAFLWIFIIIYLILSHAIGHLYLRQFHSILWGVSTTLLVATIIYSICMAIHSHHLYKSRVLPDKQAAPRAPLADYWRSLASNIALIIAPLIGLSLYLIIWHNTDPPTPIKFDRLSDSVLITLITSTTVSVLGILGSVMFWLFPKENKQPAQTN